MAKKVKFKNWNCIVTKSKYMDNDRIALVLTEEETGEPVATASVNVVEYPMGGFSERNFTFIKNYSENEGMLDALIEAGIVKDTGVKYPLSQWVEANLVKVLI